MQWIWNRPAYKEMRYFGAAVEGFGLGGMDVEVGVRVDVVVETDTVVEDFTEVVNVFVEEVVFEEVLVELELATPGMHWPGGVVSVGMLSPRSQRELYCNTHSGPDKHVPKRMWSCRSILCDCKYS